MPSLNPLLLDSGSPPIPRVQAWGRAYSGARGPLLNLCQAAPAYPPPPAMLEKLAEAAGSPAAATYGVIAGDEALREAYAAEVSALYGGPCAAGQVAITAGCNMAFFVAAMAIAGRGDAVIVPTPWYFNHGMTLGMLGIEARALPCGAERGFIPEIGTAEALLDERVRAILLVTPNNPTGAIYPPELIAEFQALCRRRGIWLILDETYRDFLPAERARPHGLVEGGWPDNLVQLYSFSKSFAIPGHRLGAIAGPPAIMPAVTQVLDNVQICPARAGQMAVAWGLGALGDWRAEKRARTNERVEAVRAAFGRLPAWRLDALGTYFAYVRHPFGAEAAWSVAERLALEHGMMVLPGPAFAGADTHLRIAFANLDISAIGALEDRLAGAA
ncbi:aminotransferase [Muricoccus radiodurans]|uniref:aminotransferase n=1 Tax=Muricoccus radiodurans TaxID=2231721 RepID=UPI003CF7CFBD